MKDKLTCGRVWLYRGPGVGPWGMAHLRGQKGKRAMVHMLGWSDFYKRFRLTFDGRMEPRHMVHLTFDQTGVVQTWTQWTPEDEESSSDPKACSSSSEEK